MATSNIPVYKKNLNHHCFIPRINPIKIPNGASVHTKPEDAMDSAVPLMYPPPTVVAAIETRSLIRPMGHVHHSLKHQFPTKEKTLIIPSPSLVQKPK